MAVKKAAPSKVIALTSKEKLVAFAKAQSEYEKKHGGGGGESISLRGGVMTFSGGQVPNNTLQCVIIAAVAENAFYPGAFDPDNIQPPVCYAFGVADGEGMVPHPDSSEIQNETCEGCPNNEWGSADTGRGKACKNSRKLALITPDELEDVGSATLAFVKLPPTALKPWTGYVDQLERTLGLPTMGVVTEFSVKQHPKTQFEVSFKYVEEVEGDEVIDALISRHESAIEQMTQPYAAAKEPPPPQAVNRFSKPKAAPPKKGR